MTDRENYTEHEKFDELCALATSGALSAEELAELDRHLKGCDDCRVSYREYRIVADEGMSHLAYVGKGELVESGKASQVVSSRSHAKGVIDWRHLWGASRKPIGWALVASCMAITITVIVLRLEHKSRGAIAAQAQAYGVVEKLDSDNATLKHQLRDQADKIAEIEREDRKRLTEIGELRAKLSSLDAYAKEVSAGKMTSDEKIAALSDEKNSLNNQLSDLEKKFQNAQLELSQLRSERQQFQVELTRLDDQIESLRTSNRDQEAQLHTQAQFLASDRDIRELIGARQLLMADVFDVSSDSKTRKPYGRVFYTKGKSLIFYAFDLDHQPGVKNATFQAWGRNESKEQAFNLGILYIDNEANRRWALRFDNPKLLAEIDSVFVTIEPHGGSPRPTGKPFLYASLRREANHP